MRVNKLNDLDARAWLKFQKSWFVHNPPPRQRGVLSHPAKFPEEIEKSLGLTPAVPPSLDTLDELPEKYDRLDVDYEAFREYLIQQH